MLSIQPKIAFTNIFDRYRKNILQNLLRYFIRPYPFYLQTNIFDRPVSSVATTLLSLREVWGSFLGPVKSDTVTRHRCDIFLEFEAVLPRRSAAEPQSSLDASANDTERIIKV